MSNGSANLEENKGRAGYEKLAVVKYNVMVNNFVYKTNILDVTPILQRKKDITLSGKTDIQEM